MDLVNFPDKFYQNDSVTCEDYYDDYLPNDGWTLEYVLNNGNAIIKLTQPDMVLANTNTNNYEISVDPDETTLFDVGFYTLNAVFSNLGLNKRVTKNIKKIEILQDLVSSTTYDDRSWAEIALENVQNYIKNKLSMSKSYEIAGRKLENYSFKEITDLVTYLRSEIARENSKKSKKGNGKIYIQFTNK